MGFGVEFNFVLKLKEELNKKDFAAGRTLSFRKDGNRYYPLGIPMLLADKDWNIIGVVKIKEFTSNLNETKGSFDVVRVFDQNTAKVFTENYSKKYVK